MSQRGKVGKPRCRETVTEREGGEEGERGGEEWEKWGKGKGERVWKEEERGWERKEG